MKQENISYAYRLMESKEEYGRCIEMANNAMDISQLESAIRRSNTLFKFPSLEALKAEFIQAMKAEITNVDKLIESL